MCADSVLPQPDFSGALPGRVEAELLVADAHRRGDPTWAALFVVDGLCLVTDHYGYSVGDEALDSFRRTLSQELGPDVQLFRWSATSFLAFFEFGGNEPILTTRLRSAMERAKDRTTPLSQHLFRVYLGLRLTVLPVNGSGSLGALLRELDFWAAQGLESGRVLSSDAAVM